MLLSSLAKQWHESESGLLSSLDDYWEVHPDWKQKGVPKNLGKGKNYGYGLSAVSKKRLGGKHTIFSKHSPHMSAVITQYIASQFAYHLDFPLAPVLFGPDTYETHSLRMVFNERSGSLYEAVLEKLKLREPDVPSDLQDLYDDYKSRNKALRLIIVTQLARDFLDVAQWCNNFRTDVYSENKETISRWAAFLAMVDDSESTGNIGNVIVSLNDPKKVRYFIDSHPNLQEGSNELIWGAMGTHSPVKNDGNYFIQTDVSYGAADLNAIEREIEGFKELLTDEAIDLTIYKASMLAGRLLSQSSQGFDSSYFMQLRDFYKSRRDTLTCEF